MHGWWFPRDNYRDFVTVNPIGADEQYLREVLQFLQPFNNIWFILFINRHVQTLKARKVALKTRQNIWQSIGNSRTRLWHHTDQKVRKLWARGKFFRDFNQLWNEKTTHLANWKVSGWLSSGVKNELVSKASRLSEILANRMRDGLKPKCCPCEISCGKNIFKCFLCVQKPNICKVVVGSKLARLWKIRYASLFEMIIFSLCIMIWRTFLK